MGQACTWPSEMFKRVPKRRRALTVCLRCGADYVNPVEWRAHGRDHWWMLLRCGGCGTRREAIVPDQLAQRFDRDLDRGLDEIGRAADRLRYERLTWEADAFAAALQRDLISAEDFAR
jgi:hypothetical protein